MTDVTIRMKCLGLVLWALSSTLFAQAKPPAEGPAESLYLKLLSVGLDSTRVYRVRNANLDHGPVHISLDDGTIAFTREVDGHITGALFQGDGEILLVPPNTVERASLALFTDAAILEERFSFAYFRFNDDVYDGLKDTFREAEDPASFIAQFDKLAAALAQQDALRLLLSYTNAAEYSTFPGGDHLLHAYLQGNRLGALEVQYDSLLSEPISLGHHTKVESGDYYDVWASFADKKSAQPETDPDAGLLSIHDFEITQFSIQTDIRPPTDIAAVAELSISSLRSGSHVLLFELSRLLQVQGVEINDRPAEFIHNQAVEGSQLARRGNDALAVFLPAPMQAGDPIELKIRYSGAVLSEAASGLLYVGARGTWYPNIGFAMATFRLEFRYPAGWTLVSVGRLTDSKTEGDQQVADWQTDRKIPVAGFNLGKYSRMVTRAAGVNVETYATSNVEKGFPVATAPALPMPEIFRRTPSGPAPILVQTPGATPSPSRNLEVVSSAAAQALDFYSRHFGPYPYSGLMLTQFPGTVSQGWPGLIFLSSYSFLTPQELEQVEHDRVDRLAEERIVAHETAHQWWGDLVTWRGYRDQWIMEALANYSALLLLESKNPAAFRELMQRYRDNLLVKNSDGTVLMEAGPVTLGVRLSSSKFPDAYQAISYGRGTWMFHMLRTMLRDAEPKSSQRPGEDEPFLRALRALRKEYEGKAITTAQLLSVFEAQLPKPLWYEDRKSLDWFYESWLNGTAVPRFELRDVKIASAKTGLVATGTIVQDEAPNSLVTAVPLYAVVAGKPVFLRHVFAEEKESSFRIPVPAGTRKILLDPEQTLLSRAK